MSYSPETSELVRAILAIVLGAVGTFLLLPHPHGKYKTRNIYFTGLGLSGVALLLLANFWTSPSSLVSSVFFYLFGLSALGGGILTVTSRNPVYSALWFAAVVLATSGLFLLAGAQFLAAGTIIVYAGAIIVTFLFVIMLAQMEGKAGYDRSARTPARATFTCFLLFWGLLYAILCVRVPIGSTTAVKDGTAMVNRLRSTTYLISLSAGKTGSPAVKHVLNESVRHSALLDPRVAPLISADSDPTIPHVAGLGGTLFTDHLITVELAGVLLFVALVGAIAIVPPRQPIRPITSSPDR